jgi:thiol-disulfide isomerase/thioredoxin
MPKFLKLLGPGILALGIGAYFGLHNARFGETWFSETRSKPSVPAASISDISLVDVNNRQQQGSQWLGKVVVLNHWASWCPPCVEEIPMLIKMQDQFQSKGLQIVGIAHDTAEAARVFGNQVGINYPSLVITTGGGELMKSQGSSHGAALPFTAIFDRSGNLAQSKLGILDATELTEMVDRLL